MNEVDELESRRAKAKRRNSKQAAPARRRGDSDESDESSDEVDNDHRHQQQRRQQQQHHRTSTTGTHRQHRRVHNTRLRETTRPCAVCKPTHNDTAMRRGAGGGGGRGGSVSTGHTHDDTHYDEDEASFDELGQLDGLSPGLKLIIQGKRRLQKCIWAQTVFQLLKTFLIIWAYVHRERVTHATIAACVFALIAIFSGRNALEKQSVGWTKAYILFVAVSATLAAYPLYKQAGKGSGWSGYKRIPQSTPFPKILNTKYWEGIQDCGSITVQVLGLAAATNLLKHFLAPRQNKGVTHQRETSRRSTREQRM